MTKQPNQQTPTFSSGDDHRFTAAAKRREEPNLQKLIAALFTHALAQADQEHPSEEADA